MSRPSNPGPAGPSRPLGTSAKPAASSSNPMPRRSAGALPGLARTASSLRQGQEASRTTGNLASIPAHLRNMSTPRIPSPLGKGTPARGVKQSLPVRTSKTTERHVLLPEDAQLAPIPRSPMGSQVSLSLIPPPKPPPPAIGSSRHAPPGDERSDAEKMTKRERQENGLPRLTAYATAEAYRLKLLQAFLKREHGVGVVRVFDDCIYAVYTLPLLPGYAASTTVRSSPAMKSPGGVSLLERMTLAEDLGYDDSYFPSVAEDAPQAHHNPSEYILSESPPPPISPTDLPLSPPIGGNTLRAMDIPAGEGEEREQAIEIMQERMERRDGFDDALELRLDDDVGVQAATTQVTLGTQLSPEDPKYFEHIPAPALSPNDLPEAAPAVEHDHYRVEQAPALIPPPRAKPVPMNARARRRSAVNLTGKVAEAVFFSYGVSVFYGFQEDEEKDIMDDVERAGIWVKGLDEEDWEVDEFHYVHDPAAEFPRIYNDMFTFKSNNHLFKLSLAHALAQSTKLSIYEATMQESLSLTSSFPKELSTTGHLQMNRREALKMTGRLFRLRMDVNLIGGILDTPELFWSEASLYPLYEAIREYLEIGPRAQVLNDRLAVAGDLLEVIHEYIEEKATDRITWIIIWLIVVACFVEFGEVLARLIFHALPRKPGEFLIVKGSRMLVDSAVKAV
ncbi:hypothetical protein BD324DRAFT_308968 [Kockovaella imperatae]|uniref:DUF155 domain-containing protein n=1 Tax=Kockovaella imperatae TaxID=4999 RepID=A0A1Y1UM41_9TREE|nr:hypothetical protein BD324DRAFT_308968 [Kockovaella imperatae]ORX39069.1 hypothetical protein BD324DRAFT_308968 [Kockovaella imperatae]